MIADVFKDLPELHTERLLLRKLKSTDADAVFQYASDPQVARYTTWEFHRSIEASREFVNFVLQCYEQGKVAPWALVERTGGRVIGTCGFVGWKPNQFRAEVGFALARSHWNKGFTTEAGRAVMEFAFDQGVNRLEGRCYLDNVGSARVLEKLGMRFEGILRQHIYAKGQFYDVRMYSMLKEEWLHNE
ncbi:MAG: GNAT family N-acetyltransferase [Firmicutes bacterium]|nr:GNAT family N-acetyltransferase [Bacillota bacterium]